jgi:hypothetical protein
VVEHLPSKHEVLSSNPPILKEKKVSKYLLQVFIFMKKKKESFMIVKIYLFFNTIAASNILVWMFQREERSPKHSMIRFACSRNSKGNTPLLVNIMAWGVEGFHDKNIILVVSTY